jgi:CheY-like chemotaxis protein
MSLLQSSPYAGSLTSITKQIELPAEQNKLGILVADDSEMVRTLLGLYFRRERIPVWLASDGEEAIDIYQHHAAEIGMVLLDQDMPGLDGVQTLVRLKQIKQDVRCYFLTEDEENCSVSFLLEQGVAGYCTKPFFFKILNKSVHHSLENAEGLIDFNKIARSSALHLHQVFGDLVKVLTKTTGRRA